MIYVCGCKDLEYDSKLFEEWKKKTYSEIEQSGDTRPTGFPKTWAYGKCNKCGQQIRHKRKEGFVVESRNEDHEVDAIEEAKRAAEIKRDIAEEGRT